MRKNDDTGLSFAQNFSQQQSLGAFVIDMKQNQVEGRKSPWKLGDLLGTREGETKIGMTKFLPETTTKVEIFGKDEDCPRIPGQSCIGALARWMGPHAYKKKTGKRTSSLPSHAALAASGMPHRLFRAENGQPIEL
jgi:hypothetical protein